jgi:hypothetical protein
VNVAALSEACTQILAHAVAGLGQPGAPGAPTRRFVSAGDPDAACETLAVWGSPFPKPATDPSARAKCAILPRAEISIRLWQCAPTGANPTTEELDAKGHEFVTSLWAVWGHLAHLITSGALITGLTCSNAELSPDPPQIDRDQGGLAGWLLRLSIDLTPLLADPAS